MGVRLFAVAVAVAAWAAGNDAVSPPPVSAASVGAVLPGAVAGLRAIVEEDAVYTPETIYSYIDGGAEVYLAYGMRACFARRYAGEAGDVLVDVFELPSSADAFGTFTLDRDGDAAQVGQGALLRPGWLSLWKGRFFVSVTATFGGPAAQEVVLAVGAAAASAIPEEGELPELLGALPEAGRVPRSVRWVRHPVVLAAHLFLAPGDPLSLAAGGEAAIADFARGEATARVVLVEYPDAAAATAALDRARRIVLPDDVDAEMVSDASGVWTALGGSERSLALVIGATSRDIAEQLLAEALKPRLARRCGTKGRGA